MTLTRRDPARIDVILAELRAVWIQVPNWRLGQLIANAAIGQGAASDPFYVEDDKLLEGLMSQRALLSRVDMVFGQPLDKNASS